MTVKPKRKPKEKREQDKQDRAQVEFVAPHPLAECLYRLRDTKRMDTGFISPGIDPSFEKVDDGTYRFKIRRTWYDYRYRRHSSSVELRGYLRALDNDLTVVIGKTRLSPTIYIFMGVFALLAVASLILPADDMIGSSRGILMLLNGAIFSIPVIQIYFDRRTLVHLIHTTLAGDV